MTTALPHRVTPSENAIFQDLGQDFVLLDINSGVYFGLDKVGARVWALLGEQQDMDSVVAAMLDQFDVEEARLRADLAKLIHDLAENGLVTVAEA